MGWVEGLDDERVAFGWLDDRHDMAFVIPSPMFLLAFSGVQ
jgi:hypothetical protein